MYEFSLRRRNRVEDPLSGSGRSSSKGPYSYIAGLLSIFFRVFVCFCLECKAKGLRRPVFHRIRHGVDVPLCGSGRSSSKGPTPRTASLHVICFSMFSPSSGTQSSGSGAKLDLYRRRGWARHLAGKAFEDGKSFEAGKSLSENLGKIFSLK